MNFSIILTFSFFLIFLNVYLFEREIEIAAEIVRESTGRVEAGSMHRETDVGFDPGSPGSRPEPKAGAKLLRHPGIPSLFPLIKSLYFLHLFSSYLFFLPSQMFICFASLIPAMNDTTRSFSFPTDLFHLG